MPAPTLRFNISDGALSGSGGLHWIDQGAAAAPGPQAAGAGAQAAAGGDATPAARVMQTTEVNAAAPSQTSGDSATVLSATATPALAAPQPVTFLRNLQPWSQARVDALIAAGSIQAGWLPDIRAAAPEMLNVQREHQRDMLRFSNSIANTGANNWQVRRGLALDPSSYP